MHNKTIKYVGFYDSYENSNENRNFAHSAVNKMKYIAKTLNENGYNIELISPSWTVNKKKYKGKKIQINPDTTLKLFPTIPWKGNLGKVMSVIFSFSFLFFYLLFMTKKNEQIIVYHSKWLTLPILMLKKIKKINIILEVEEIYVDIKPSKFWSFFEFRLFKSVEKYIFPTELLNEKLNEEKKPYLIIYGSYQAQKLQDSNLKDKKIHVVYAGTFDPRKGGAYAAVDAAEFLPENYHMHIIGFGSSDEIKLLINKINKVSEKSKSTLSFDGLLQGEEYLAFLQKCHIGLSTQEPYSTYNETSFPSKILSYLGNGLRVVSARIKAIELSEIGSEMYYYEEQTPQAIAKAIVDIDINKPYHSVDLIKKLDRNFSINIKKLLEQ